ncbi:hypothetical protein HZ326_5273 [Fusarium oxysporum f. sp. albedinis]|nr:hypothetical protein HZ326_5273 [Fusarium oxysporum f. sp. albedinis]
MPIQNQMMNDNEARLNLAYYVTHACRLPIKGGKNPLGRADQEKETAAPVASRQPNPLDQWRRLYIMNSGTCLYSTVLNPSLIWTIVNSTIIRSFDIGLSEWQDLLEVVEHVGVSIG